MLKKVSKAALWVVMSSFVSFLISCNRSPETTIRQRGELVVAMDAEMPGYFVLGGESYGYQYDLFKAYAAYLGVRLRVVTEKPHPDRVEDLGTPDIVATMATHIKHDDDGKALRFILRPTCCWLIVIRLPKLVKWNISS